MVVVYLHEKSITLTSKELEEVSLKVAWVTKLICLAPIVLFSHSWQPHQPVLAQQTDTPLQQAKTTLQEGRYYEAEKLLRKVVEKQPDSAEAYYNLGLSLHLQTKDKEAIFAYQNAIRINPKYDSPYINLGLAFIEQNQLDKANTVFHQVLELPERTESPASNHTLAYYNLAIIYKRQDNQEAALEAVKAALAITPDFAPAQSLLKQYQSHRN